MASPSSGPATRLPHVLLGIYVVICLTALTSPGLDRFGNRVDPRVFGLPFVFAWHVGWVLATCLVLALYHRFAGWDDKP